MFIEVHAQPDYSVGTNVGIKMAKLTALKVRTAKPNVALNGRPTKAVFQDGNGLFLLVKPSGARFWMLRIQVNGKRRDIGLGTVDVDGAGKKAFGEHDPLAGIPLMMRKSLSLAEAREKAAALRKLAKAGANPIAERDKERRSIPTFAEAVDAAHRALSSGWAERTASSFKSSLIEHACPTLGGIRVDQIGAADIIAALAAIWTDKPVIAKKVRSRIMQVLAFAKARGWRIESLPDARELRTGLAKQPRGGNFAAVPFVQVPEFVASQLVKEPVSGRLALLFAILTAARSGEVRFATWEQIDLEALTWSRSAKDMKGKIAHVVRLNDAAVAILALAAANGQRSGLIFPGARADKPLSDMSITRIMRLANRTETVHGFRSAFRDWAAERMPNVPAMVAEMALAHRVGTATEQAYLRTDLRDMRALLMEAWGDFVAPSLTIESKQFAST